MIAVIRLWAEKFFGRKTPVRAIEAKRLRLFAAVSASLCASALFVAVYYATLTLLPSTGSYTDYQPIKAWQHRLELAQFLGTLVDPPYPIRTTWFIGAILLYTLLVGAGVTYALLCSWGLALPNRRTGLQFGAAIFFGLASFVSLGSGFNPAVMRQTLPDVGFFFLGWSGWATLQLFTCSLVYGWCLSKLYRSWIGAAR